MIAVALLLASVGWAVIALVSVVLGGPAVPFLILSLVAALASIGFMLAGSGR